MNKLLFHLFIITSLLFSAGLGAIAETVTCLPPPIAINDLNSGDVRILEAATTAILARPNASDQQLLASIRADLSFFCSDDNDQAACRGAQRSDEQIISIFNYDWNGFGQKVNLADSGTVDALSQGKRSKQEIEAFLNTLASKTTQGLSLPFQNDCLINLPSVQPTGGSSTPIPPSIQPTACSDLPKQLPAITDDDAALTLAYAVWNKEFKAGEIDFNFLLNQADEFYRQEDGSFSKKIDRSIFTEAVVRKTISYDWDGDGRLTDKDAALVTAIWWVKDVLELPLTKENIQKIALEELNCPVVITNPCLVFPSPSPSASASASPSPSPSPTIKPLPCECPVAPVCPSGSAVVDQGPLFYNPCKDGLGSDECFIQCLPNKNCRKLVCEPTASPSPSATPSPTPSASTSPSVSPSVSPSSSPNLECDYRLDIDGSIEFEFFPIGGLDSDFTFFPPVVSDPEALSCLNRADFRRLQLSIQSDITSGIIGARPDLVDADFSRFEFSGLIFLDESCAKVDSSVVAKDASGRVVYSNPAGITEPGSEICDPVLPSPSIPPTLFPSFKPPCECPADPVCPSGSTLRVVKIALFAPPCIKSNPEDSLSDGECFDKCIPARCPIKECVPPDVSPAPCVCLPDPGCPEGTSPQGTVPGTNSCGEIDPKCPIPNCVPDSTPPPTDNPTPPPTDNPTPPPTDNPTPPPTDNPTPPPTDNPTPPPPTDNPTPPPDDNPPPDNNPPQEPFTPPAEVFIPPVYTAPIYDPGPPSEPAVSIEYDYVSVVVTPGGDVYYFGTDENKTVDETLAAVSAATGIPVSDLTQTGEFATGEGQGQFGVVASGDPILQQPVDVYELIGPNDPGSPLPTIGDFITTLPIENPAGEPVAAPAEAIVSNPQGDDDQTDYSGYYDPGYSGAADPNAGGNGSVLGNDPNAGGGGGGSDPNAGGSGGGSDPNAGGSGGGSDPNAGGGPTGGPDYM